MLQVLSLVNVEFEFFSTHAQHYWVWCVNDMVGDPFNGSRINFDTILELGFEPKSTPKASSEGDLIFDTIFRFKNLLQICNLIPKSWDLLYIFPIIYQQIGQKNQEQGLV